MRRIGVGQAFVLGTFLFPAAFVLIPLAGGPRPLVLGLLSPPSSWEASA
ncbi:MAG TPA: hypothetical protein VFL66_02130 [Gaiellaceae bacterium]|nr:hypothetical protein [Gaiellaceae bacterium]